MKIIHRTALVFLIAALAGCHEKADLDPTQQSGGNPPMPEARKFLLPPMQVPDHAGWKDGQMPKVASGLKIEKIAGDLMHPRQLLTLPNGDVLVVEANGPGEEAMAETIVERTGGSAIVLAGDVSLLIAVARRVALAIAGDTGPLHLACALGKPVVGIFGPTDPSRNGPFLTRFTVLRSPESRRDHTRRAEPEAGLLTIEPEAVLQAADALLYPEATQ